MRAHGHDGQRGNRILTGVSQVWKTIGLTVCFVCVSAGYALAVTGNLEPPPGEATNLNTGEPRPTTPTQPSWANRLDGLVGPAHRWKLVMGGEAVLDRETGLVWEQSPQSGLQFYREAVSECINRTIGGRKGWRLPSIHELASLIDPNNTSPALPTGHSFSNIQSSSYWSATTLHGDPGVVWFANFSEGFVSNTSMAGALDAWCVRGGGPLSVY